MLGRIQGNSYKLLVGMKISASLMESSVEFPQKNPKTKTGTTI
jgi:hypothetical protein